MLTPIDEIANQNHLQLIKAAVAFLPPQSQRSLSLLIKLLELEKVELVGVRRFHASSPWVTR